VKKLLMIVMLCSLNIIRAEGDENKNHKRQIMENPSFAIFNVNNIATIIQNNGQSDHRSFYDNGHYARYNFRFPIAQQNCMICASGFVWGGKVNGEVRVGGAAWGSALTPGKIFNDGTAQDPYSPLVRVYRIRPDYKTCDLTIDINDSQKIENEIRDQYKQDWMEWPAEDGAPFDDKNGNGIYEPEIDIPGVPGADQTLWYVANDLDEEKTKEYLGSLPLGIELQVTVWGYKYPGALSNMMFRKYILVNKGRENITDMYLGTFSDADVGSAYDDFIGCDTTSNLGFYYNAGPYEEVYGETPPSLGFQLLQGPVVEGNPNDIARVNGNEISGKKNLDMTAIGYLFRWGPPEYGEYRRGTMDLYNFLQGRNKLGNYIPVPDELGGGSTPLPFAGDPITKTGYLDGMLLPLYDRRLMVCSGPFEMSPGEKQEVIYAFIAAGAFEGCSNLGSLGLLKIYAEYSKLIYDNDFNAPEKVESPSVDVSTPPNEIILTWEDEKEYLPVDAIYNTSAFSFQGYNIYQFPNQEAGLKDALRIGTIDKIDGIDNVAVRFVELETGYPIMKVKAYGRDTGLNRYIQITEDCIYNRPLFAGTNYYFAVTTYYILYKDGIAVDLIESDPEILKIMPESEKPGIRYEGIFGEDVEVLHSTGSAAGKINVNIINPTILTGHEYEVTFSDGLPLNNKWNLVDATANFIVLEDIPFSSSNEKSVVVDGFSISVENTEKSFGGYYYGVKQVAYGEDYYWEPVWNSIISSNANSDIYYVSSSTGREEDALVNIEYGIPNDFELRFTEEGGYAVYAFEDNRIARVPFELWDINSDSEWDEDDDVRMIPFLLSNDDSTKSFWGWGTGTTIALGEEYPISDRIFWAYPEDNSFGAVGYDKFVEHCELSGGAGAIYDLNSDSSEEGYYANLFGDWKFPISDITICDYDRDGNYPPTSTIIRFYSPRAFLPEDTYNFTTPGIIYAEELEIKDVEKINVFPNPYYGGHANELNQYHNYVMFNHLPKRAKFRIFNLAGHLVRTLEKDDDTQFYLWDLQNEHRLQAPSGLYIIYIEMPDLQKVKVLKLAIVQREVVPGNF